MNDSNAAVPKIILLGDSALHTLVVRNPDHGDRTALHPFRGCRREASKPLLPDMIEAALLDGLIDKVDGMLLPNYGDSKFSGLWSLCGELVSILDNFPRSSGSRKDGRDTLRVRSSYFLAPNQTAAEPEGFAKACADELTKLIEDIVVQQGPVSAVLVLYDHGSFLRTGLPRVDKDLRERVLAAATRGIVVGVNSELAALDWLVDLMHPAREQVRSRTVVQVTADGLRKAGLAITKYGALEQTVADIFDARDQPPLSTLLELAEHVVVVFSETGGIYLRQPATKGQLSGSLLFCPNFDRIAQSDPRHYGVMPGKFSIFLVALVKAICRAAKFDEHWELDRGVGLGAVAYNRHFGVGLGPSRAAERNDFDPFASFKAALSIETCRELREQVVDREERSLLLSSLYFDAGDSTASMNRDQWTRTSHLRNRADKDFEQSLIKIVVEGLDAALVDDTAVNEAKTKPADGDTAWFPESLVSVPYAAMGKLKLLDHDEIAKHYSLAKLIRKYIESIDDWKTPLSIAVFGRPGSGKSFGVKQILDAVDPGRKSQALTFNLAQFSSVDQLTEAFHQIQDRALASEEVPLAIFDEFDARFETPFGWLKYFLAPMQDGVFRGKTGDYKVGRAIFLFAGGTSDSYAKFREPEALDESAVRAYKLTDFVSRLRGSLDIAEVNDPSGAASASGVLRMTQLRRAVILRSLLDEHAKPIFVFTPRDRVMRARIHPDIVCGFLYQPRFTNGVRSMEAIIQMSRWIDDEFVAASLPAPELLRPHIGSETFLRRKRAHVTTA